MTPHRELKIRVLQVPDRFGYQLQFYTKEQDGSISIATNMDLQNIKQGQKVPDTSMFPIERESLKELGEFLAAQGLIKAPVTEAERKEHERVKQENESLCNENAILNKTLADTNKTLDKITSSLQAMIEKHKGEK